MVKLVCGGTEGILRGLHPRWTWLREFPDSLLCPLPCAPSCQTSPLCLDVNDFLDDKIIQITSLLPCKIKVVEEHTQGFWAVPEL